MRDAYRRAVQNGWDGRETKNPTRFQLLEVVLQYWLTGTVAEAKRPATSPVRVKRTTGTSQARPGESVVQHLLLWPVRAQTSHLFRPQSLALQRLSTKSTPPPSCLRCAPTPQLPSSRASPSAPLGRWRLLPLTRMRRGRCLTPSQAMISSTSLTSSATRTPPTASCSIRRNLQLNLQTSLTSTPQAITSSWPLTQSRLLSRGARVYASHPRLRILTEFMCACCSWVG